MIQLNKQQLLYLVSFMKNEMEYMEGDYLQMLIDCRADHNEFANLIREYAVHREIYNIIKSEYKKGEE